MKHADLVAYVAAWLRSERGYRTVLTESSCSGTVEEPDVIAWKAGRSTLVECKRSRADFLADKRKAFRSDPARGMGRTRLYAAAPGIILPKDLPDRWGLLEVTDGGRVQLVVTPGTFSQWNRDGEIVLLAAALERGTLALPTSPASAPKAALRGRGFGGREPKAPRLGGKADFDRAFPKVPVRAKA